MDPSKKIGKIKEQVKLENISRRRFPEKWGKLTDKDVNRFYNQDEINKIIRTSTAAAAVASSAALDKNVNKDIFLKYVYTGHGDSYFVSKDMFESLVAKCRCGRQRTEGHSIKCLQRRQSKYFNDDDGGSSSKNDKTGRNLPPSSSSSLLLSTMMASGDNGSGKRVKIKYNDDSEGIVKNDCVQSSKSFYSISSQSHNTIGDDSRRRIPETSSAMIGWPRSRFWEWEKSTRYISPITKMHGYKVTERPYNVIFIG